DGSLWLANRGYIGRLTEKGWEAVGPQVADQRPLIAAAANDGGLWVYFLLKHRLMHYHADGSLETFRAPAINEIRELCEDHSGMVWIGSTLTGLVRLKPGETNYNRAITIANGLANNVVLAITEDKENNLWVGTGSGGLHRLVARRFTNIGLAQGLPNPIVRAVIEESPGHLLVGTHGGGMARVQDGRVVSVHRSTNDFAAASAFIWSELCDHAGRIWLGTFNGGLLYESNGVEHAFEPWPETLSKTITCLHEDAQNRIWMGTLWGLGVMENDQVRPFLSESNQPLAGVNIRCIVEDKSKGVLWLGTYDDGIFRVEEEKVTHFGTNEGLPAGHICSVTLDSDGCIWAGVYQKGIIGIRDGKIVQINSKNGLPAHTIGSMLEDGLGNFWLGSERGILRVAISGVHQAWTNPAAQIAFDVFDANDGLASLECAEGFQNTALRDTAGRLWFATQKGVATVDPGSLRLNTNPPPVIIERVTFTDRAGSQTVLENPGRATLPAGATELKIDYAALSYTAPDKIHFVCRMEGVKSWAETNRLHSQIFHTLDPGDYHFAVRAANNDGLWNKRETVFDFKVEPFLWQTTVFWAVVLGGLAM
ncbi:MAG: hypothetical protein JF609_07700, partial [Verrucomicrobia bacterium]|nr:hypothetical protein [Verrucomicrobiota bacterium]